MVEEKPEGSVDFMGDKSRPIKSLILDREVSNAGTVPAVGGRATLAAGCSRSGMCVAEVLLVTLETPDELLVATNGTKLSLNPSFSIPARKRNNQVS